MTLENLAVLLERARALLPPVPTVEKLPRVRAGRPKRKRPLLDTFWNRKSFAERFWSQVDVRGEDKCWPWRGGLTAGGYGSAYCPLASFEGAQGAHRVAYFLTRGDPGELRVRHVCHHRPCCNPQHLFAGAHADEVGNVAGDRNHVVKAKLTASEVREVRALLASGLTPKGVAPLFGLHPSTVRRIRSGETWKFVR